jgi:antitoxin CcdA
MDKHFLCILQTLTRQYGVHKWRPPYPPVTGHLKNITYLNIYQLVVCTACGATLHLSRLTRILYAHIIGAHSLRNQHGDPLPMSDLYNTNAPKKAVNVSINSDLLQEAKILKINLSATLEQELVHLIRQTRRAQWLKENRPALDDYNAFVEKHGVFSDGLRQF